MEDKYGKYIRLFGTIFFTFVGFILVNVLLLLLGRLFFGLLDQIPWTVYIYMLLIIIFPSALFITIWIIYFRRTKHHPSAPVRYISWGIFTVMLLLWAVAFIRDLVTFLRHNYSDIGHYYSYEMYFLAANVAILFLVGIMQAFTTQKEVDWMDRQRNKE